MALSSEALQHAREGEEAERILGEILPTCAELERAYIQAWKEAPDTETREACWYAVQGLEDIKRKLGVKVKQKNIALKDLSDGQS